MKHLVKYRKKRAISRNLSNLVNYINLIITPGEIERDDIHLGNETLDK